MVFLKQSRECVPLLQEVLFMKGEEISICNFTKQSSYMRVTGILPQRFFLSVQEYSIGVLQNFPSVILGGRRSGIVVVPSR